MFDHLFLYRTSCAIKTIKSYTNKRTTNYVKQPKI